MKCLSSFAHDLVRLVGFRLQVSVYHTRFRPPSLLSTIYCTRNMLSELISERGGHSESDLATRWATSGNFVLKCG